MRKLEKIFLEKWYTKEEILNHYNYIKYKNNENKKRYKQIEEKYKIEITEAKKHFKNIKVSLKWDWIWCNNKYWRIFIYFNDLTSSINFYSK